MNFTGQILSIIKEHSGITTGTAHTSFVESYAKKRISELNINETDYLFRLKEDNGELRKLINNATINETYFFREEEQFNYLSRILLHKKNEGCVKIWSAACSTGQEPLSIYALCKNLGINAKVYASDIDTAALEKFKEGKFSLNSFRNDGSKYKKMLEQLGNYDGDSFYVKKEHIKQIDIFVNNLARTKEHRFTSDFFDIIFIRNVFIYFTPELRLEILSNMASMLKPGGILFISINEIPSVNLFNNNKIELKKVHEDNVYFFKKTEDKVIKAEDDLNFKLNQLYEKEKSRQAEESSYEKILESYSRRFFKSLAKSDYKDCQEILKEWPLGLRKREFYFYFQGIFYRNGKNCSLAKNCFYKASVLNENFWPALYQQGLLEDSEGKKEEACRILKKCSIILNKYVEDRNICYNLVMEDLAPQDILKNCLLLSSR
ncbi:CheR family methyltransferase [Treponema sp.]|uniref:CheR family methyltransferase n=1 Tax=Treponema sp. TaxID=166 RepID=UPI0025CF3058|nr:CheR family methyltransferase [Treponema sp.]MCR5218510.1 hypothetical protein [Treponema sp.]